MSLRAKLTQAEDERDAALSSAPAKRQAVVRGVGHDGGHHMPPMPTLIPGELTRWIEDRHAELQDALLNRENTMILEITSKLAEGASQLHDMTSGIIHSVVSTKLIPGMGCVAQGLAKRATHDHAQACPAHKSTVMMSPSFRAGGSPPAQRQ